MDKEIIERFYNLMQGLREKLDAESVSMHTWANGDMSIDIKEPGIKPYHYRMNKKGKAIMVWKVK